MIFKSRIEQVIGILVAAALLSGAPSFSIAYSQPIDISSYNELQAAYIYNIAKFIEWPSDSDSSEIRLCILDEDLALYELLEERISKKTIQKHSITITRVDDASLTNKLHLQCDLVYLNRTIDASVIASLRKGNNGKHSVLWVASPQVKIDKSVLIYLQVESERIVIYVNKAELDFVDFKVRSQLLSVARLR